MSNKVLKLAGRRPMLLALTIMATLTLGVICTGWLTPTSGNAQPNQPNPPPNIENTNCPNYVTNAPIVVCPVITNAPPYYGPYKFCLTYRVNSIEDAPVITNMPGATPGYVITSVTETCSNVTTYVTNPVVWSFSGLNYYIAGPPPNEYSRPSGSVPYTRDCYIEVTSSDAKNCPGPGTIDHHQIAWNILDPFPITTSGTLDVSKFGKIVDGAVTAASSVGGGCKVYGLDTIIITLSTETSDACCGDGTVGKKVKEKVDCGLPVMGETCNSPKFPVLGGVVLLNLTETIGLYGSIAGSEESQCGVLSDLCMSANLTVKASGGVEASIIGISSDYISASASVEGSGNLNATVCAKQTAPGVFAYDPTNSSLMGCLKTIDLKGSITLFSGYTQDVSCNLYTGNCAP